MSRLTCLIFRGGLIISPASPPPQDKNVYIAAPAPKIISADDLRNTQENSFNSSNYTYKVHNYSIFLFFHIYIYIIFLILLFFLLYHLFLHIQLVIFSAVGNTALPKVLKHRSREKFSAIRGGCSKIIRNKSIGWFEFS